MSTADAVEARTSLPRPALRSWVADHPVTSFFMLTFAISWSMWLCAYLTRGGIFEFAFFVLGGFGPLISAASITKFTGGSIKQWAALILHWRVPARWYLYAFGLPALIWTAINVELALLGQEIDPSLLPRRLLTAAGTFFVVLTVGGGLEEPGWRGFALSRLQQRLSPVKATLLLGFVWGLWHLPLYGPLAPVLITVLAFFYTYLYNKTGSVLLVVLLHAVITPANDTLILMPHQVHGITDAVIFGTVLIAAIVLILLTRGRLGYDPQETEER
ncbi:MAG TPA: type II CAAX endopeptidase family protein [Actinomycetota bacterium]|nr:type II CAAX endopeptidase family protein [Actinomycetota bacterium]